MSEYTYVEPEQVVPEEPLSEPFVQGEAEENVSPTVGAAITQEDRERLVDSLFFQDESQKSDLLDNTITKDSLIAALLDLVFVYRHHLEITSVKTDHGDDSSLGEHSHFNGYCADLWPLQNAIPGNYVDAGTETFRDFLRNVASLPTLLQIGLVGDGADSTENFAAAGPTAFQDDGGPHVHLGTK